MAEIGLSFSTKTRRPEEWLIDREDCENVEDTSTQVRKSVSTQVRKLIICLGKDTCKMAELQERLGISTREYIRKQMIVPAISEGYVAKLHAANNSSNQAYFLTPEGLKMLAELKD